jgi:hypothetical protein
MTRWATRNMPPRFTASIRSQSAAPIVRNGSRRATSASELTSQANPATSASAPQTRRPQPERPAVKVASRPPNRTKRALCGPMNARTSARNDILGKHAVVRATVECPLLSFATLAGGRRMPGPRGLRWSGPGQSGPRFGRGAAGRLAAVRFAWSARVQGGPVFRLPCGRRRGSASSLRPARRPAGPAGDMPGGDSRSPPGRLKAGGPC